MFPLFTKKPLCSRIKQIVGNLQNVRYKQLTYILQYVILLARGLRLKHRRFLNMLTTATTKGQVVIPSKIRHQLGIKEGTKIKIEVDEKNHALILMPITREYIRSLRGKFRKLNLLEELTSERKREKEKNGF